MTGPTTISTRLHHNAHVTTDMEVVRKFYEEIIGMPLVATWCEKTMLFGKWAVDTVTIPLGGTRRFGEADSTSGTASGPKRSFRRKGLAGAGGAGTGVSGAKGDEIAMFLLLFHQR